MSHQYSPKTHRILRCMCAILQNNGVDYLSPPPELKPLGPTDWRDYSLRTIRLLRWAIGVLKRYGPEIINQRPAADFKPEPFDRKLTTKRTWEMIRADADPERLALYRAEHKSMTRFADKISASMKAYWAAHPERRVAIAAKFRTTHAAKLASGWRSPLKGRLSPRKGRKFPKGTST